jgi:hypothetical protein
MTAVSASEIRITNLPPGSSGSFLGESIGQLLPLVTDYQDRSTGDVTDLRIIVQHGVAPETVLARLGELWAIRRTVDLQLSAPLSELLRSWVGSFGTDGIDLVETVL